VVKPTKRAIALTMQKAVSSFAKHVFVVRSWTTLKNTLDRSIPYRRNVRSRAFEPALAKRAHAKDSVVGAHLWQGLLNEVGTEQVHIENTDTSTNML